MNSNELYHHGVKGMKWGVRKDSKSYSSTGLRAAIARRQNEKVDASFKKWKENSTKREDAISLGKKANASRLAYENDRHNKALKKQYKQDNAAYKKQLRSNTTYRKGQIKKEVLSDISRKHLSEAKKVKKQLDADPTNKQLQKQYSKLMSEHDIERANARKAPSVAQNRARKKAAIKRTMTMTVKTAATSAVIAGGMYAANKYLSDHNVTLNGNSIRVNANTVNTINNAIKLGQEVLKFI
jgi:hypothetical protein